MAVVKNKKSRNRITPYGDYIAGLQRLAIEPRSAVDWEQRTLAALDGQASAELRRVVALKTRRKFGAFFTGSQLAGKFIACCPVCDKHAVIYDPSLGVGDLLLAAASRLPLQRTVDDTLCQWGLQLMGTDLHSEFVRGAKARLILLARRRHGLKASDVASVAGYFPGIRVADGLTQHSAYERATHLFLNPPFGLINAPAKCKWAGGRITAAATFVVTALERANPGTELIAILPDVLRSGSFSEHWRKRVEELAAVKLVEPYGIFDESADVDVFILRVKRRGDYSKAKSVPWTYVPMQIGTTIGDYFDVHVGRVVPHRDPEKGNEHPYIHARCVPTWEIMRDFKEFRRHEGRTYAPPFVVIRRTSRPGHPYRAAATVIAGNTPVAVENHLIVCEPKDKTLKTCRKLMDQLQTSAVNQFLDARIRCRHLTVGAIAAVPFSPERNSETGNE
jgi:hypothetical protein